MSHDPGEEHVFPGRNYWTDLSKQSWSDPLGAREQWELLKKFLSPSKTLFERAALRTKKQEKQDTIKHTTHKTKRKEKPTKTLKIIEVHDM